MSTPLSMLPTLVRMRSLAALATGHSSLATARAMLPRNSASVWLTLAVRLESRAVRSAVLMLVGNCTDGLIGLLVLGLLNVCVVVRVVLVLHELITAAVLKFNSWWALVCLLVVSVLPVSNVWRSEVVCIRPRLMSVLRLNRLQVSAYVP